MQTALGDEPAIITSEVTIIRLSDELAWGVGAIQPQPAFSGEAAHRALLDAAAASLSEVSEAEAVYSACTDGRLPVRLLSGEPIPVREQMVGADIVSAFYIAECLGARFYKNANAPAAERVREVAEFLKENGIMPSSHLGCGAAAGFVAVSENIVTFSADRRFTARLQELLPGGVYDSTLQTQMLADITTRLNRRVYGGLSADTFLEAAEAVSGKRAIAELQDDGRGVHGHVEEAIIRLRVPGYALNEARVAELTGGREVFGVNDLRLERLARLFSRGTDEDYRLARMALENFASAGHGTLAKNLPTYIIELHR